MYPHTDWKEIGFFYIVIFTVIVIFFFLSVAEVQAIASMIEKQAQIVVKQKEVSEDAKKRKEALLAQYANVTDEEEYPLFFACNDKKVSVNFHVLMSL